MAIGIRKAFTVAELDTENQRADLKLINSDLRARHSLGPPGLRGWRGPYRGV